MRRASTTSRRLSASDPARCRSRQNIREQSVLVLTRSVALPLTATVLPDVTGLDKTFDYLVPDALRDVVRVGSMVRVPLHGRRVGGWVLRVGAPPADLPEDRLVPIAKWSGIGPAPDLIELAEWASVRWGAGRLRPFLVTASPPSMVRSLPSAASRARPPAAEQSGVAQLLRDGGGVVRITPNDDLVPILMTAAAFGPALVVHPSVEGARVLAAAARRAGLSVALMPDEWARAAAGVADVVIGGRAAAWASGDFGCIVVLDEHDEALQEERSPTWHARDVLVERARGSDVPCLLVSPCPTVSALAWSGRRWMRPTAEAERAGWPVVDIVDRSDDEPWKRSLVTTPLITHLRDPSKRVVCVHNVPGRARVLACRSCRSLLRCERCDAAVAQEDAATLRCHRCETMRPPVCQSCGSAALANVRPGVTRLREELEAAAGRAVAAVTGTSDDPPSGTDVFVGTEAVLHRVRRADIVVFLDIDAELLAPRYRAAEQAMALLVRAARVVGPRSGGGRIVVQTFLPRHDVLQAALLADPGRLAKVEAERRRELGLPPFSALARVSGAGAAAFVAQLDVAAATDGDGYLLRSDSWDDLGRALASAPRPKGSRVRVEVDPPRR